MKTEKRYKHRMVVIVRGFVLSGLAAGLVACTPSGVTTESGPAMKPVPREDVAPEKEIAAGRRMESPVAGRQLDVSGFYELNQPAGRHWGKPLPWYETDDFVGSTRCAACHDLLEDKNGNDMSISGHWRSTMMANAARDPLWQAKVGSEVARNPELKQVIEQKCATCHMPVAWTQSGAGGNYGLVLDEGFLSGKHPLHEAAMDGVSCSLCHQIRDENLGTEKSFSGKYAIDTDRPAPDREIFGPYREPFEKAMRTSVGYTPTYGKHTNDGALCGTCHTLFTPYVDGRGRVAGEFPEQTPYLEWLHSDYGVPVARRHDIGETDSPGRLCQECHMPHSEGGEVMIARWSPPEAKPKDHFSRHHFVGGNIQMLNIMQENITGLGIAASTEELQDTKIRTLRQLQSETAALDVVRAGREGGRLITEFLVTNLAGHKFPTGIPIRRTWLHVTLSDSRGGTVFESGRPLADGRIQGNDADENPAAFEPHYSRITDPGQVQIYEGIMVNTEGDVTNTLLRAAGYVKDNRLLPRGFDKQSAGPDIAVYGAASGDGDFSGGADRISYVFDTEGFTGPFTLRAMLLYTPLSHAFIRDLRRDARLPLVEKFLRLYDPSDKTPVPVAGVEASIP